MTLPSYPLAIANGTLALTSDYPEKVRQAILSCLQTEQTERVYEPDYGLQEYIFETQDNLTDILVSLESTIADGLRDYPEVRFTLRGALDEGAVVVQVIYQCPDETPRTLEVTF